MNSITTVKDYDMVMSEILALMDKGEANLSPEGTTKLRDLALAAQAYEKRIYSMNQP